MLRSWTGGDDRAGQAARPSRFQVRPIGREDEPLALEALDRNPVRDVFIASRILHDGALTAFGPSPLWGAFDDGQLRGLLHVGPNLVPATDDQAACEALAAAAGGLYPTRMVVGERVTVELLWSLIGPSYPAPREVRRRQFVYAVEPDLLVRDPHGPRPRHRPPGRAVRRGPGAAALGRHVHRGDGREPAGPRPRRLPPPGPHAHLPRLDLRLRAGRPAPVQDGRRLRQPPHRPDPGRLRPPELRGRGVGTTAMAACCDLALDRHPNLSLYVNDFNTPAVALYERIGFHREPYDFQTIMLP